MVVIPRMIVHAHRRRGRLMHSSEHAAVVEILRGVGGARSGNPA